MTRSPQTLTSQVTHSAQRIIYLSAPSLDEQENVSGVASVVREIFSTLNSSYKLKHLLIGSPSSTTASKGLIRSIGQIGRAAGALLFNHYDVYHSNTALNPKSIARDVFLMAIARCRRKTVIWHVHGGYLMTNPQPRFVSLIIGALFKIASSVVVLSQIEKHYLSINYRVTPSSIIPIKNGTKIGPVRVPREEGAPFRAVFAGRLVPEKGIDILIDCFRAVGEHLNVNLSIYGSGPLVTLVKESLNSRISYHGVVSQNEIRDVLRNFDLVILPSRNGEGMPMIIVEAMAVGVVPIATSMASIPEIIEDSVTGYLITPNAASLASAVEIITQSEGRLARMSQDVHAYAIRELDAGKNFSLLKEIYG